MNEEIKKEFGKKIDELKRYLDIDSDEPVRDVETMQDKELGNREIFKRYYFEHIEKATKDSKIDIRSRNEFNEEYPLSRLKQLTIDEYALGGDNYKDTFSYKIEFGKYKYVFGVGGGSAKKHGIYWKDNGKYAMFLGKKITREQAESLWKSFRNQLAELIEYYYTSDDILERKDKFTLLKGMPLVITKLLFLYHPNKFTCIGSKGKLIELLDYFEYEYTNEMQSEELNFILLKNIKQDFDFLRDTDSQIIGNLLWKFITDIVENVELEDDSDVENTSYSKKDFLDEVYISEEKYNAIIGALKLKKNIILEGAPGVGKTFMAKRLAYSLIGCTDKKRIEMIQFHQSYSYEDFVEGIRPNEEGEFILQKGIFYKFCKKASNDSNNDYYLIIDEINRGNLSKIFGELLMLMESDKREEELKLVYSQEKFSIPSNLYIIGCMNTADRSLALMDYALRRRFSFIRIDPAFDNQTFLKQLEENFGEKAQKIKSALDNINSYITEDKSLGKGFVIGHSYFCGKKLNDLENIITYEILPLFEEYWYDDDESLERCNTTINGVLND